jgi:hypothetical protein
VLGDVADGRAPRLCGDVVPAQAPADGMGAGIEAVAGEVGHVDAADERELVVDDDRLFLVIG